MKIICIGRNYIDHAKELNNPVPKQPMVFLKPTCTLLENGGEVILPQQSDDVHHEVEVVILIGKEGKNIAEGEALDYVAGYAIGIDMTARDVQSKAKAKGHPWSVAKGFETFAPISRFVKAGGTIDPDALQFSLSVDGTVRQSGNTADMIFNIPTLIQYLSTIFRLQPGDLVYTGTPAGVGPVEDGAKLVATLAEPALELSVTARKA